MPRLFSAPVPHPFIPPFTGGVNEEMTARGVPPPLLDGCEEIPGGMGEFGRSPDNPIPVDGASGALSFLDRLRLPDGSTLLFHRIGRFTCRALHTQVVCLEVVSVRGSEWDLLFFSLDHRRASHRLPSGYNADAGDAGTAAAGSWSFCPDFPSELFSTTPGAESPTDCRVSIGPDRALSFERPDDHSRRLARLMLDDAGAPPS